LIGQGKRWKIMAIEKVGFEGVGMVAERGVDGERER
jgi:hypothetical protein